MRAFIATVTTAIDPEGSASDLMYVVLEDSEEAALEAILNAVPKGWTVGMTGASLEPSTVAWAKLVKGQVKQLSSI